MTRNETESQVTVATSEGVDRYFDGLGVSEHFITNGLPRTGSEPKPMNHTSRVAKPR